MKTILPAPKTGKVPASVVQQTVSEAISSLFGNEKVNCEMHTLDDDVVIVMMANGVCATLHVQKTEGGQA